MATFSKKPAYAAASAGSSPATESVGARMAKLFANPLVSVSGAGLLLLAGVSGILFLGDPMAGAPSVKVSLGIGPSEAAAHGVEVAGAGPEFGPNGEILPPFMDVAGSGEEGATSAVIGDEGAAPGAPAPAGLGASFQPGLVASGPSGPLPVIAPDGRTPAQAYARPFRPNGHPKIALVIGGLGINPATTREAIDALPPEVTLSFAPCADAACAQGLQNWIDQARAKGHEVLLETPMEPVTYPKDDPGPYTLMANARPDETTRKLETLMGRATGYFGLTNYMGSKFVTTGPGWDAFTASLRKRGLAFIDDGSAAARSSAGVPRASADRIVDDQPSPEAINRQLAMLEAAATQKGEALGSGLSWAVTVRQVAAWAKGLPGRGYQLAPASALAARR